jgi:hypothetical protein
MSRLRLRSRLESLAASLARVAVRSGLVHHNEVAEKTNLLASYIGTKAVDESDSANLVLIDFFSSSTFSSFAALNQRRPYCPKKQS